jgi:Cysteine-rich secretory protein family
VVSIPKRPKECFAERPYLARAAVGSKPLLWDTNLQAAAQAWADHMAQTRSFDHDPNAGTGENIFWASPAGPDIQRAATADWLNEKAQFHGGGFTEATGHYTQVCNVCDDIALVASYILKLLCSVSGILQLMLEWPITMAMW